MHRETTATQGGTAPTDRPAPVAFPWVEEVHIREIKVGDICLSPWDGVNRTVGSSDLTDGGFHGRALWGDSFRGGALPVLRVQWPQWTQGRWANPMPEGAWPLEEGRP